MVRVLTCANHFVDGYTGGIQLLGELVHGLARVLVRMGVHIGPDSGKPH